MPAGQTRTRTTGSTRVQVQPARRVEDDSDRIKCTGHHRPALRLTAGPQTKNPGRAFYTCPLPRDDPQKCRFFKWEDELHSASDRDPGAMFSPSRERTSANPPRTLGQSPAHRFGHTDNRQPAPDPPKPENGSLGQAQDEIDWAKVDAESLEQGALARTPTASQRTGDPDSVASTRSVVARGAFNDRLREASGLEQRKRKPDHDEESLDAVTPKRAALATDGAANPFLSPATPRSGPIHPAVSPALDSLESVSEHIRRQDRLLSAAQQMKEGLRKTIGNLQQRNKELEERNRELEMRVKALEMGQK